ncbi:MAG TPA: hypothetical protein VN645_03565 [Steroidobacteraceae bacterium]|nr:hypothetical protein [Steroidobacteraceae bacterium]
MASSESAATTAAWRGIWLRTALFVLTLAAGWSVLEWVMLKAPNSMSIKRERLEAIANEVDTLILGSSETYYGLKPKSLSGVAYNLASNAQSLYYDYALTADFLPRLPRLRRTYVLVSYLSLYTELYDHPDSSRIYGYLQDFGIPLQRMTDYMDPRVFSRVLLHSPHTAMERLLKGLDAPRDKRIDDRGWYRVPDEDRWPLDMQAAAGRLAVHHGFMRSKYLAQNRATLERLIQLLQKHHVEVVLITTPVAPSYQAQMLPEMWQPARMACEEIAARYGIRYLNFQNEPRIQASDFEDSSHLNADGAEHLAQLLEIDVGPVAAGISGERELAIAATN